MEIQPLKISSNYSILNCFARDNKEVKIFITQNETITIYLKTVKQIFSDDNWMTCYSYITRDDIRKKIIPKPYQSTESLDEIKTLVFELGMYSEYKKVVSIIREQLSSFIQDLSFDFKEKTFKVNDITITSDIWNYIIYVLKLSCGEKESKPITFQDERSKQLYLAQKEFEQQVNKIKGKSGGDNEQLLKIILTITYEIPSLTFDYLLNQTMAQIHWLYNYAAKSVSYKITAKAYAAGNLKKGSSPDFFIKF